jgi:uncharacterized protein (TIGR02270 family)
MPRPETAIVPKLVAEHAEEAAFLWAVRRAAVDDPAYSLRSLTRVDDRLEAHVDGLRIAGPAGWQIARTHVESGEAAELFPLAVLAFDSGDRERMRDALAVGCASAANRDAVVSALGWLHHDRVATWISRLLAAQAPVHRTIGVAACAIRRDDPGAALDRAVDDADLALRRRSLRAVGELKRRDLMNRVREHLSDDDDGCRFWASWTLALHRDPAGVRHLTQWIGHGPPYERRALELSVRAMAPEEGREWIRVLAKDAELARSALIGAGALGDPTSIPWIIRNMRVPALARVAGEALSTITGIDLEENDLAADDRAADGDGGGDSADGEPHDEDQHLPAPDVARVEAWWQTHHSEFAIGVRHLAGVPITTASARAVLESGTQRQRAAAALELALRDQDRPLFEVRARAHLQARRLRGGRY